MKPKQAAALLTNNNQYLLHAVVKGLKGKFEPVSGWFKMLYNLTDEFDNILDMEAQVHENFNTLLMVLNTFKTGFFSHNSEIAALCCRVMQKLGKRLVDGNMAKTTYDWFVSADGGITAMLYVLKRHTDLMKFVVNTMVVFGKGKLTYVFRDVLRQLYPTPLEYSTIINDFVGIIATNEEAKTEISEHGLIDQWIEIAVRQADSDGKHTA